MDAVVTAAAMTQFGIHKELRLRDLAAAAADAALDQSGLEPEQIGLVAFGNAAAGILNGQEMIRGQVSLGHSRVAGRPMINMENACASSSSAFHIACLAVDSSEYDAVLVVGAEKMTSHDRSLAGRALATAIDVERTASPSADGVPFMEIYAAAARAYMTRTGATAADYAAVAAKATHNGSLNPLAHQRKKLTPAEVLTARMIVDPLTRPMCSSITDGAAAVVLCSPGFASRHGPAGIRVLSTVVGSGAPGGPDDLVANTCRRAYEQAGLGPDDIDVLEVHDAAAPAELTIYEELGLADPGDGAKLIREGTTRLRGPKPVNPSGGLLARGHPIGATGVAQIVELFDQLRGRCRARQVDGARRALAENAGGDLGTGPAACVITILGA